MHAGNKARASMLQLHGTARFVSDVHLREERGDIADRFVQFLNDTARKNIAALFILGYLFEYWIGDDDLGHPFNARISSALRTTVDQGTQLFFIAGNRDFLIGDAFAAASGLQRLPDPAIVDAENTPILLLHGDTLCTDDRPYQQFRTMVRATQWQNDFLARPLSDRRAEVETLRRRSAEAMRDKTAAIMDTNPLAVQEAFTGSACRHLIHGHTHRPGQHTLTLPDGSTATRWVLSDWDTDRGDALEVDASGIRRIDLSG